MTTPIFQRNYILNKTHAVITTLNKSVSIIDIVNYELIIQIHHKQQYTNRAPI